MAERYPILIKKLFWAHFFNNLFWLSSVITFFYLHRNLNYTQILSLGAIISISIILFEVPTGRIADIYGRKRSLIFSSLSFMVMMGIYLYADNFFLFALASIFAGLGITFTSGAAEALIYEDLMATKKQKKMHKYMGLFISAEVLAGIISPPIASIIARDLSSFQFNILIYLTLISYFVGFLLTLTLKERAIIKQQHKKKEFLFELKKIWKNKKLVRLIFNGALFSSALASYLYLWQPQLQRSGVPIALLGIALALGSLGILLSNINIEKINNKIKTKRLIFIATFIPGILFIASIFIFNPYIAVLGYLLIRISSSIRSPIFSKLTNENINSKNRASILSVISMITAIFSLVLQPIIGAISDLNFNAGLIFLGSLCLIAALLFPVKNN